MAKKSQKLSSQDILNAIISQSAEAEERFLKIFTDLFGGEVRFDDDSDCYIWKQTQPKKPPEIDARDYDVEIEVSGGVAYLVKKLPGISLQIRDYDNEDGDNNSEDSNYDKHESIGA